MNYRGLELDRFQREAIEALQQDKSVLVAAPTGTGKTLVADWIVEEAMRNGETVIYTAPIKALSNQKFRDYCSLFGAENVGLVTGDLVIRRDAPCKVMTTEILRNILLSDEVLDNLAAVIIDEIHFLDDAERGTTWEEVLIYLPAHVLIVGLSATLSNLRDFAKWLSFVREREVVVVEESKRAVPLGFRVATKEAGVAGINKTASVFNKNIRGRKKPKKKGRRRRGEPLVGKMTTHLDVFRFLNESHRPYLYFVFSRAKTEILARSLGRTHKQSLLAPNDIRLVEDKIADFLEQPNADSALDPSLIALYKQGIAFHHAGLHVMLKALVEELYEQKLIKVLYCTGTFALGINMPARTAVFDGLERYDGSKMIELPTREFMQMAGRAGRRGLDKEGLVVMRMNLEDFGGLHPRIKEYLSHKYEPVLSRFSLSFNSVVNLLDRYPLERIRQFVERSFKSWHLKRQAEGLQREATAMERAMIKAGIDLDVRGNLPKSAYRKSKEVRKLRKRAKYQLGVSWGEFQDRIQFLIRYQYINEDYSFNAGARALTYFQIQEVFVAELFLEGILDSLSKAELYGVLCGMVVELPRSVHVRQKRHYKKLSNRIVKILRSDIVQEAAYITKLPLVWEPSMIPIGKAWAQGQSLSEILEDSHEHRDQYRP